MSPHSDPPDRERRVAGILLAAGLARRMGRQKLLLDLRGKAVVRWSTERLAAHVDELIVVVGHDGDAVRAALRGVETRAGRALGFVTNPRPEDGQGTSIAYGARAIGDDVAAAFVALGDQPGVPDSVFTVLLGGLEATGVSIVTPIYRGIQGTPVLFAADVFPELRVLSGDTGARPVVIARPGRVRREVFDLAMPEDVDTPEDYARLV